LKDSAQRFATVGMKIMFILIDASR